MSGNLGNGHGNGRQNGAATLGIPAASGNGWRQDLPESGGNERQAAIPAATDAATSSPAPAVAPDPLNARGPAATIPLPEAARLLGWSERTLRDRVKKNRIPAVRTEGGYRLEIGVVEALRRQAGPSTSFGNHNLGSDCGNHSGSGNGIAGQPLPQSPASPATSAADPAASGSERQVDAAAIAALAATVAGLRAELRAVRDEAAERGAMVAALQADRSRLESEVIFLRDQLRDARRGEGELRVLLLRESEQVSTLAGRIAAALPAPGSPRRWWQVWRRSG